MYVEARQIIKWKPTKKPHPLLACALCGRKMAEDEDSMSAIWRAQGGQYIQAYHVECAKIVKLWGLSGAVFVSKGRGEMGVRDDLQCVR